MALRPSFSDPVAVLSYFIDIRWADEAGHPDFSELKREDARCKQAGFDVWPIRKRDGYPAF